MIKKLMIAFGAFAMIGLSSCTKDIDRFNENIKNPAEVPADMLYTNAVRNMTDALASSNVNLNPFRFAVQHWAATTYQDEPRYEYATRNIPTGWWTRFYRDVLTDLKRAKEVVATENVNDNIKANKTAMIDIMEVQAWYVLVTSFGDIPYSEALDANNLFPKYDDDAAIFADLFTRLSADIAALDEAYPGIGSSNDIYYGGDIAAWKKFAYSLNMKMAITIADVDNATAKSVIEASNAHAFESNDDNATFNYLSAPPNTNPLWADLVQSGRKDMVGANTLINKMLELNDPRLPQYFGTVDGAYVGGVVGQNNTFATTSKPSDLITDPTHPYYLLTYSEIEFIRAEAIERGYSIPGTAAEHYENAIEANIILWGGTQAEADAYLAQPSVAYATATGDWKNKIGTQKWIALYDKPFDGWVEYRRLDAPTLPAVSGAVTGFPNRFLYPSSEGQLNPSNYAAAGSAIGGDEVETKLFWDIH